MSGNDRPTKIDSLLTDVASKLSWLKVLHRITTIFVHHEVALIDSLKSTYSPKAVT